MTDLSPVKALLHTLKVAVEDRVECSDVVVEVESRRVFQQYGGLRGYGLHLDRKMDALQNGKVMSSY